MSLFLDYCEYDETCAGDWFLKYVKKKRRKEKKETFFFFK